MGKAGGGLAVLGGLFLAGAMSAVQAPFLVFTDNLVAPGIDAAQGLRMPADPGLTL